MTIADILARPCVKSLIIDGDEPPFVMVEPLKFLPVCQDLQGVFVGRPVHFGAAGKRTA